MTGGSMKKIGLAGIVVVLAAGLAVFLDPTQVGLGYLKGEKFYRNRPTSYWSKALQDPAPGASTNTRKELVDGGAAAVPVLIELLQQKDGKAAEVRRSAADALNEIGPEARAAAPVLIEALKDQDPMVRDVAITALGALGPKAASIGTPALAAMLPTEHRLRAVKALRNYRAAAKDAIPELTKALGDPSAEVRWETAETLGDMGAAAGEAGPALSRLLKDPEEIVRAHAAEALWEIGPASPEVVKALVEAVRDPSEEVRKEALKALKKIDPETAARILK
jgi:HEAT repeat protein